MAVSKYVKDGKTFWRVYLNLRSRKNPRVRIQKRITGITSEKQAYIEERRLTREATEEVVAEESHGATWGETVERWVRFKELDPGQTLSKTTLIDAEALLQKWTAHWWNKTPSELNRSDGREALTRAADAGRSAGFCKRMKSLINQVYTWGLEERLFTEPLHSPVFGVELKANREEKIPEILTAQEIRELLKKAYE